MKRLLCAVTALVIALSAFTVCTAAEGKVLLPSAITEKSGVTVTAEYVKALDKGDYFGFPDVDLTGINSVWVNALSQLDGSSNGDTLLIMTDDPVDGKVIGKAIMTDKSDKVVTVKASITPVSGKHTLYFRSLYGNKIEHMLVIQSITLSPEKYVHDNQSAKVSDDKIIDVWSDTWVAVDDMGRNVADYEEVGDVKTDTRIVGMPYWDWFNDTGEYKRATVISDVLKAHPDQVHDYAGSGWDASGRYYWSEPVLGFYTSYDYWVHRKHAEMLANAGVDVIFFDYTNDGLDYIPCLDAVAAAYRDAKASGINIPRLSALMTLNGNKVDSYQGLAALYYNCFVKNDYSDIWYYYEGKPLLYGNAKYESALLNTTDEVEKNAIKDIENFFTYRWHGGRNSAADGEMGSNAWMWLENFPQILRNPDAMGRPEFMVVGLAINQSTVYGNTRTGNFSDDYNKGRGYSEVFGDDYRDIATRKAYFFREQAALALEGGPKFLMVDGWNEWTAIRGGGNTFCDLYDDNRSRDFEPSRGVLKDDSYNLLVDLIRKFKGVRPAPTASGMKTIDINGDASQWEGVGPEFLNNYQDYERDSEGLGKAKALVGDKYEPWHYTTTVNNAIKSAKVTFDSDNFYFMVKTEKAIKTGTDNWMHLYINADRNHATGREGYDYAVNIGGAGVISSYNNGWAKIGDAAYTVQGDTLQMVIPRALIGETGIADLEFKWTDSVGTDDLLNFYSNGSAAPLGRFNYLFTEVAQTSLSEAERNALKGSTIIKAGKNKMIVSGGKQTVYEPDTRVTPFEANGTLYIPEETFNEVMGYGRTKTEYVPEFNLIFTHHYDMSYDLLETENYIWTYSALGSNEVRVNGKISQLSAPAVVVDGIIYIPASLISDCYGWTVRALGDGAYLISSDGVSETAVQTALSHIG